jgi:hypothetical protein
MKTTMDLPNDLLRRARRAAGKRTNGETVIAGLEELINRRKRHDLRLLAGRIRLDIDLTRSRGRRSSPVRSPDR